MEDRSKSLEEEQTVDQYLNDIKAFVSKKNEKEKDKLYEKLKIAKTNLIEPTIPENIVRSAIINYIINYTNVNYLSKNKEAKKLADEFIKYFPKKKKKKYL